MLTRPHDLTAVLEDVRVAVTADAARTKRRSRFRRRRYVTFAFVPVAFALGTGAWALTQLRGEDVAHAIACHDQPSLRSPVTGVLAADGRDPTIACAEDMWRGEQAPPLVACANREHSIVDVFPSEDPGICTRLGLAPLPADYQAGAKRTRPVLMELQSRLNRRDCYTETEAIAIGRAVLNRHGFEDWDFKTLEFGEDRRCATGEMSWLGSRENKTAGVTAIASRKVSPFEAVLESPDCRGSAEAATRLTARLAKIQETLIKNVIVAPGTPEDLRCADYGVVDYNDAELAVVIGALGPALPGSG